MFRSIHRQLVVLAAGLGVCALLPWTGAVQAQPRGGARNGFAPYQAPGPFRPNDPFSIIGTPNGFNPFMNQGGNQGQQNQGGFQGGFQGGQGGFQGGGFGGGQGGFGGG